MSSVAYVWGLATRATWEDRKRLSISLENEIVKLRCEIQAPLQYSGGGGWEWGPRLDSDPKGERKGKPQQKFYLWKLTTGASLLLVGQDPWGRKIQHQWTLEMSSFILHCHSLKHKRKFAQPATLSWLGIDYHRCHHEGWIPPMKGGYLL